MSPGESIRNHSAGHRSAETPCLSVDSSFTEVEAWAEASGWDLDFRQLSAGRLSGRVRVLSGAHCTAMKVNLNQAFHQVGQVLPGRLTFGLPHPSSGEFNWCRSRVQGGDILNFNQEGGFEGATGKSFSGCALSFERESLEELAELLELRVDLDELSRCGGALSKANEGTKRLRTQFDLAFQQASERGSAGLLEASALSGTWAAESILRLIARTSGEQPNTVQTARRRALRRALEVLEAPENFPITVAELCAMVGVSAPSLYRAFQEELGVSPKQYIRSRVLSAVRSELVVATPGTQINDIANAWGIWHMGKFAADYRTMFGELPSETLRSRRR